MKGGNKLFLFAGVGLALVAILLGITMSSGGKTDKTVDAQGQEDSPPTKMTVVRLLQDVEQHQIIKAEMVEEVEIDVADASPDAVTSRALVLNQAYAVPAVAGDVLLMSFLESPGITSSIDPGMRAISLQVDAQGSMSGLIVAGDYVDVVFLARVDLQRALTPADLAALDSPADTVATRQSSDDEEIPPSDQFLIEGEPGTKFRALDAQGDLEPVAKMLVQDVRVIRVIQPGMTFDGQGQQVAVAEGSASGDDLIGQLIVQVTPQQAEAVTFMQDETYSYSVAVRGEEDHTVVPTSGVTFQILMTDGTWSLPWPLPVSADEALADRATPVASTSSSQDDEETP